MTKTRSIVYVDGKVVVDEWHELGRRRLDELQDEYTAEHKRTHETRRSYHKGFFTGQTHEVIIEYHLERQKNATDGQV